MSFKQDIGDKIPVFIVHDGPQLYVKHCIIAAKRTNHFTIHANNIEINNDLCDLYLKSDLKLENFEAFKSTYIHMSTNSYEFELSCFKRFFILQYYVNKFELESIWLADSDLLLVLNLGSTHSYLEHHNYICALSWQPNSKKYNWAYSPHLSFWTRAAINSFANYLTEFYNSPSMEILQMWKHITDNNMTGGICDMTLLYLWAQEKPVYNLAKAYCDGLPLHDHNMNAGLNYKDDNFKMNPILKLKKIQNFNPASVAYDIISKKQYEVGSLHFQGSAKIYIQQFTKKGSTLFRDLYPCLLSKNTIQYILQKIYNKLVLNFLK